MCSSDWDEMHGLDDDDEDVCPLMNPAVMLRFASTSVNSVYSDVDLELRHLGLDCVLGWGGLSWSLCAGSASRGGR